MVFDWLRRSNSLKEPRQRLNSTGEEIKQLDEVEKKPMIDENALVKPRRSSIFQRRGKIGADEFSREYFDQMGDMWVSECDRGYAGRGFQTDVFKRTVPFGQDEFSREYFDSMEDMFVAESELGDAGFMRRNSLESGATISLDDSSPFRRIGEFLRKPVGFGKDEFSREYAREMEDFWLAKSGKEPSGIMPSALMRRVRLGSDPFSREYQEASTDNWLAESDSTWKNQNALRMVASEIVK